MSTLGVQTMFLREPWAQVDQKRRNATSSWAEREVVRGGDEPYYMGPSTVCAPPEDSARVAGVRGGGWWGTTGGGHGGIHPKWYGRPRADTIGTGNSTKKDGPEVAQIETWQRAGSRNCYIWHPKDQKRDTKEGKGPRGAPGHWTWVQRVSCFYPCNLQQNEPGGGFANMPTLFK